MTSPNDSSRALTGIHGDSTECRARSARTPVTDARMNTASRQGGETVGVITLGEFSVQGAEVEGCSGARDAECHRITAAEAERGQSPLEPAVGERMEERDQDPRPARADRMA